MDFVFKYLEFLTQYIAMFLIQRYVFLEHGLEKEKQKRFYIITLSIGIILCTLLGSEVVAFFAMLACGVNILLARKGKKLTGFFLVFPIIGIMDGLVVPIMSLPNSVFSFDENEQAIYLVVIYAIIGILLFLFYKFGKGWRNNFEKEMRHRYVENWEKVLLWIVGTIMMFTSQYMHRNVEGIAHAFGEAVAKDIASSMLAEGIMSFVLTVTTIVLIMQGNKRSYYTGVAENRRQSMERMSLQMVQALAKTIDAKDTYTNGHSTRVAEYSVMIAKRMGYTGEKLEHLYYAALLHDIGKIGVPREIINKPARLTDEEYAIIKSHPSIGANILKEVTEIPDIAIGARYHHERYDGKGYPDGLCGLEIPELARIIGVADAYDAMTSKRSYRDVLAQDIVLEEIEKGKGTQFDSEIAQIMIELMKDDVNYKMHE